MMEIRIEKTLQYELLRAVVDKYTTTETQYGKIMEAIDKYISRCVIARKIEGEENEDIY